MYTDYTDEKEENYYADDDNKGFDKEKLKKIAFYVILGVIIVILLIVFAKGCSRNTKGQNGGNTTKIPVVSLDVTSKSMAVGEKSEIIGSVSNVSSEVTNPAIIWYSTNSNVVRVSDEGTITAVSVGEADVVAVYQEKGKKYTNKCKITVTNVEVKIEKLSFVQEKIDLGVGDNFLLQLSITPFNARIGDITYESSNTDAVIVDSSGYIYGIALGTSTITAKTSDDSVKATITVNVVSKTGDDSVISLDPTSIKIIKLSNGLSVGTTSGIVYELLPTNATNNRITWTSQNPEIASVKDGVITGVSAGTTLIIATTENGLSDKILVTVESNLIPVETIKFIGDSSINMELGGTYQLEYSMTPDNATNKKVKFQSSNENVIYVTSTGKIAALSSGVANVTISTEDGSKNDMVTINVKNETSGESGGSQGSGSSGGTSGSGGSTGSGGSSGTGDYGGSYSGETCGIDSLQLKSNQYSDGARTYNDFWKTDESKAFKKSSPSPALTVNVYDSCIKSVKYSLWRNSSTETKKQTLVKSDATLSKTGSIVFGTTNGYYYVEVTITTNDGNKVTKQYYSVVKINNSESTGTGNDYINIEASNDKTNGNTTYTIYKLNSSIKKVYYCTTINGSDCSPTSYNVTFENSATTKQYLKISYSSTTKSTNSGSRVCFKARTSMGWLGKEICLNVQKKNSSVDTTKPVITIKAGSKTANYIKYTINATDNSGIKKLYNCTTISPRNDAKCSATKEIKNGSENLGYFGTMKKGEYLIACAKAEDNNANIKETCQVIFQKS